MENQILKFKTNLNCGGCTSKIQQDFEASKGMGTWGVDFNNPDRVLTVESKGITAQEVIAIVESKGFVIEKI